jgi:hypothetical protein
MMNCNWYYKYDSITNIHLSLLYSSLCTFLFAVRFQPMPTRYPLSINTQTSLDPITVSRDVLQKIPRSTNWKIIHSLCYGRLWVSSPWHKSAFRCTRAWSHKQFVSLAPFQNHNTPSVKCSKLQAYQERPNLYATLDFGQVMPNVSENWTIFKPLSAIS